MHCPQCGAEVVEGAKFCHRCAAPLDGAAETNPAAAGTATARVMSPRSEIADEAEKVLWEGDFATKAMTPITWPGATQTKVVNAQLNGSLQIGIDPGFGA